MDVLTSTSTDKQCVLLRKYPSYDEFSNTKTLKVILYRKDTLMFRCHWL